MPNFKKISKNIQRVIIDNPQKGRQLTWININNAGKTEIEFLRKEYNFKLSHLRASSAKANSERPIITREDDYVFMILHFPLPLQNNGNGNGRIKAAEIEFFIGHGYLVTIPSEPIEPLNELFNLCKKDSRSLLAFELESSAILLYEILKKLLEYSYATLDENSIAIGLAEQIILGQDQNKSANIILNLRHNLINMRKIMQNHKNIMKRLMSMESSIIPPEYLKKYYGELIGQTKTFWETMENQREMVEILYDSYQSLANYRLNNSMKMLTIFYVTFSSLSLVAAIFSMKIDNGMPFLNYQNGFWSIIAIMAIIGLAMLLLFKKKKWL
ncbi:MAG: CorA family divalent cation transporter [Patescibacteria group bacterium]|nr:CorA family divalent cation transporter [Patescibacteria group bacterium]